MTKNRTLWILGALCLSLFSSAAFSQSCANLRGSWTHDVGGTWEFDGKDSAKITLNSINYGPRAQQITQLAISECAATSMSYKIVRAALVNTVDPSMAYDKTPRTSEGPWEKSFTQPYQLNGNQLTLGNYSYTRN